VIATGANTNFFNNNDLATHAFPMKSTVEALQLRHQIIQNFENILSTTDEFKKQQLLNIVIVGGGPTGVELSGAIADMRKYVLPKDYPEINFSNMNIYLLEGSANVLGSMSAKSSANAKKYLEKLNVEVKLNTLLDNYDGNVAYLKDGTSIPTKMLIWAAGIKGNVPNGIDANLLVKGNRIKIDNHCKVIGFNNVYAIGDVSYLTDEKFPNGLPQVAPMAIQMADLLAHNFYRLEMKSGQQQFKTFVYNDKGSMATVGRNLAVVDVSKKIHIKGLLAWLIWMGLHLMLILGVKNRFFVFLNWLYNYVTYDQNLRLIFKEFYRPQEIVNKK
jgi:NADH:ubiquinone reductase (H+-translocating)